MSSNHADGIEASPQHSQTTGSDLDVVRLMQQMSDAVSIFWLSSLHGYYVQDVLSKEHAAIVLPIKSMSFNFQNLHFNLSSPYSC